MTERTDVLLVTATELETRNFLACVQTYSTQHGATNTYFRFTIGEVKCGLVWSGMGSRTSGGSFLTVSDAIKDLSPRAVIMVGIAFGVDRDRQTIGDILISEQVADYNPRRVGTNEENQSREIINRGDIIPASPRLLQRLRAHSLRWTKSPVKFGLLLTGDDLVDNRERLDELLSGHPNAIGGEMEGAGVYAAAYRENKDWIIVKAICDWADGTKKKNKKARQTQAIRNSGQFVIETLKSGGFHDVVEASDNSRHHYVPSRSNTSKSEDRLPPLTVRITQENVGTDRCYSIGEEAILESRRSNKARPLGFHSNGTPICAQLWADLEIQNQENVPRKVYAKLNLSKSSAPEGFGIHDEIQMQYGGSLIDSYGNLRSQIAVFFPVEEKNPEAFARRLQSLRNIECTAHIEFETDRARDPKPLRTQVITATLTGFVDFVLRGWQQHAEFRPLLDIARAAES